MDIAEQARIRKSKILVSADQKLGRPEFHVPTPILTKDPRQSEFDPYMPSSCREIRAELAKCMQKSDCVLINRHTVSECLMDKELFDAQVPDECHRLRRSFYNCRRGMVSSPRWMRLM